MTNQPTPELYDQQIDAILAGDFARFADLIGMDDGSHRRDDMLAGAEESWERGCHSAWCHAGSFPTSLFAFLPGCTLCASQIEWLTCEPKPKELEMRDLVLTGKTMKLPDLEGGAADTWAPTREQLLEFKRRQMVARGMTQEGN